MKTRTSLVSNSSTSSFICLVTLPIHNRALDMVMEETVASPELKLIIRKFLDGYVTKTRKFGFDVCYLAQMSGNYTYPEPETKAVDILTQDEVEKVSEGDDSYSGFIWNYQNAISEIRKTEPDQVFEHTFES